MISDTKDLILGVDLGTSSCKVCAVNFKGHKLYEEQVDYPIYAPSNGWSEQDPHHWIEAASRASRLILKNNALIADQVQGISLTSAAHIAVLLDNKDQPVRRAILWNDQRSHAQVSFLADQFSSEIFGLTNNWVSTTWTLPHLLWIKQEEPEIWQKVRSIMLSKDYLAFYLTGNRCTDPATAVSSMLYDVSQKKWSSWLCSLAEIEPDLLPQVLPATAQIGKLSSNAAKKLGLLAGIPIINGTLDSTAEFFCSKACEHGDLTLRLASAGGVHLLLNKPQPHQKLITYPYPLEPLWMVQAGTNSCATAVQWARKLLSHNTEIPYSEWDTLAANVEPGALGLFFHPYLSGERCPYWDDQLRCSFLGLSFQHELSHFARAVYEGTVFSIKDALGMLKEFDIKYEEITVHGGGAKSEIWSSIVCDVLGVKTTRAMEADSSYGTALIGLHGLGVYSDLKQAQSCAVFNQNSFCPDMEKYDIYQSIFKVYKEIQQALQPIYHQTK